MHPQPLVITHLAERQRFETVVNGHTAHASYTLHANTLVFAHTIVPPALSGRGIGAALVKHVLDYAAQHGYCVNPQCSFVKAYIDRHPDYHAISSAHQHTHTKHST